MAACGHPPSRIAGGCPILDHVAPSPRVGLVARLRRREPRVWIVTSRGPVAVPLSQARKLMR